MKIVTGETAAGPPPRWYRYDRFPLLPTYRFRPEDDYNRSDWWFHWLFLHVWTICSPDLGAGVELNDQALEFRIRVPYLIILVSVPLFPRALYQKLWRTKPWPKYGAEYSDQVVDQHNAKPSPEPGE